jgi:tetratricopeptide (TPR) repeat protein
MHSSARLRLFAVALGLLVCCLLAPAGLRAQDADAAGEGEDDPIKLYNQARAAERRNDLERALALFDAALRLRPEYPEAELEKGLVLTSLKRFPDAEKALRRAAALRVEWALPQTALGLLFVQQKRDGDAAPYLRRALELDAEDLTALIALAQISVRAGDRDAALKLYKRATEDANADADAWAARGTLERAAGDVKAADASLAHALELDPRNVFAREERAEASAAAGDYAHATEDLQYLVRAQSQSPRVKLWQQRINELQSLAARQANSVSDTHGEMSLAPVPQATVDAANSDDPKIARPALVALVAADPKNAIAHARLCVLDRVGDPQSALEHCRAAVELEPKNADYATGYAAALVQARRFEEAVPLLRKVLAVAPDTYAAHANLATALDELKQYDAALVEYRWLNQAKPDLPDVYFFIARDLDLTGEFEQALAAYEEFLKRADAGASRDEIDRVQLRLPALRRQIEHGEKRRKRP